MGLIGFIKRLLGGRAPAALPATAPLTHRPTVVAVASTPAPRPGFGTMFRSEEMLDRHGRLAGYRFSIDAQAGQAGAPPDARLDALKAARVPSLAERRLAVIALEPDDWPRAAFSSLIAAHTVFQPRLPADGYVGPEGLDTLQRIRGAGAGVALTCAEGRLPPGEALALATHAFIDFADSSVECFERLVTTLRQRFPALILAIQNVSTWPERRLCMALGAEFAMGGFLSTVDQQESGEKLTESRLVLMEMLNLVRNDGDAQALAAVAKRDPGVAVRLLSMANSPAFGLSKPVTAMDQAIMLMGREALYRWLAVSVFRAGADNARDQALLEVALARARFLELTGQAVATRQQADELFLVGLLSFVDTLLGLPMKDVVSTMSLPTEVKDVLLHSAGPYMPYLLLALSIEKGQPQRTAQLALSMGADLDELSEFRSDALYWAQDAAGPA